MAKLLASWRQQWCGGEGAMRWRSPDGNGARPFPWREQERAERVERMKGQQQRVLHFGLASA